MAVFLKLTRARTGERVLVNMDYVMLINPEAAGRACTLYYEDDDCTLPVMESFETISKMIQGRKNT